MASITNMGAVLYSRSMTGTVPVTGGPTRPQGHGANGAAAPGTLGAFQPDS